MVGDALALPFSNGSFDVVSCCLFAHHLSPPDVCVFRAEASRVARTAVLINDLIRDPLHLALVYAGLPLYRSRLTRNDAPASVRQAYTCEECIRCCNRLSSAKDRHAPHYLYRMAVIGWNEHERLRPHRNRSRARRFCGCNSRRRRVARVLLLERGTFPTAQGMRRVCLCRVLGLLAELL